MGRLQTIISEEGNEMKNRAVKRVDFEEIEPVFWIGELVHCMYHQ